MYKSKWQQYTNDTKKQSSEKKQEPNGTQTFICINKFTKIIQNQQNEKKMRKKDIFKFIFKSGLDEHERQFY